MTDELKTLKDIEIKPELDEGTQFSPYVDIKTLKSEAIKWYNATNDWENWNVQDWIKYFFNITEKDLKKQEK